jgi:hypothetical protein
MAKTAMEAWKELHPSEEEEFRRRQQQTPVEQVVDQVLRRWRRNQQYLNAHRSLEEIRKLCGIGFGKKPARDLKVPEVIRAEVVEPPTSSATTPMSSTRTGSRATPTSGPRTRPIPCEEEGEKGRRGAGERSPAGRDAGQRRQRAASWREARRADREW